MQIIALLLFFCVGPSLSRQSHDTLKHSLSSCNFLPPLPQAPYRKPMMCKNFIVITDGTNFDDVIALLYLLKVPEVNLLAIYITGNGWASAGASVRHMYNILHMMNDRFHKVPIFLGGYYALQEDLDAANTREFPNSLYRVPVPFGPSGILYSDSMYGFGQFLPESPRYYDMQLDPDTDNLLC